MTLTLYHYDRSTACQRVRLAIEEKGLDWESVIVDTAGGDAGQLPANYHELNPRGLVPALIADGRAVAESLVILEFLEDAFPEPALRPADPHGRAAMRGWMRRIDEEIHVASRVIGVCLVSRHAYLALPPDQLGDYYARMRDPVRRANDRVNIEKGLDSPLLVSALGTVKRLFADMEAGLADAEWLAGPGYSLADIALVVYLARFASFQMAPLWAGHRHLDRWREKIEARPAFDRAIARWGDRTAAEREARGREAFARVRELWEAA